MDTRGDDTVIKWFNDMKVKKGKTGLWLTVERRNQRELIRSHIFRLISMNLPCHFHFYSPLTACIVHIALTE